MDGVKTVLRKLGNSTGVLLPSSLLKITTFKAGQDVNLLVADGKIVIEQVEKTVKPKYELSELLAEMSDGMPVDKEWDAMKHIGREI